MNQFDLNPYRHFIISSYWSPSFSTIIPSDICPHSCCAIIIDCKSQLQSESSTSFIDGNNVIHEVFSRVCKCGARLGGHMLHNNTYYSHKETYHRRLKNENSKRTLFHDTNKMKLSHCMLRTNN